MSLLRARFQCFNISFQTIPINNFPLTNFAMSSSIFCLDYFGSKKKISSVFKATWFSVLWVNVEIVPTYHHISVKL